MTTDEDSWGERRSEEVQELFATLHSTSADEPEHRRARDRLVELHLPLVRYLARRFAGRASAMEDLVQVGAMGLIKAVDRFDPKLGHEFITYASPTIVGEIKRHLRDTGWLLRVPRAAQELQASVGRARAALTQELGRSPTISEIANAIGASRDDVAETLDVARTQTSVPLDALIDPESAGQSQQSISVEDESFDRVELRTMLEPAMEQLTEQERRVVILRFVSGRTQSEIAELIGVSQMQVSRLLSRSLKRMGEVLKA